MKNINNLLIYFIEIMLGIKIELLSKSSLKSKRFPV